MFTSLYRVRLWPHMECYIKAWTPTLEKGVAWEGCAPRTLDDKPTEK